MGLLDSFDLLETSNNDDTKTTVSKKSKEKTSVKKEPKNEKKRKSPPKIDESANVSDSEEGSSDGEESSIKNESTSSSPCNSPSSDEDNKKSVKSPPKKKQKATQTLLKPLNKDSSPPKKSDNNVINSVRKSVIAMKSNLKNSNFLNQKCALIQKLKVAVCEVIRRVMNEIFPKGTIYNYQNRARIMDILEVQKIVTLSVQTGLKPPYDPKGKPIGIQLLYEILDSVTDEINQQKDLPFVITYDYCTDKQIEEYLSCQENESKRKDLVSQMKVVTTDLDNNDSETIKEFFWLRFSEAYCYDKQNSMLEDDD